jgi:hypothetical protein
MRMRLGLAVLLAVALGRTAPAATWVEARSGMPGFTGLAYGAGRYVIVDSGGQIWTSSLGFTWTKRVNPDVTRRALGAVTFGGGQFVAVGANGVAGGGNAILTSPDGITWTQRSNAAVPLSNLLGVSYGNGLYVAVGSGGARKIITSPDGITWTAAPNLANALRAVAFGGGTFVAVGNNRTVVTSSDGATWTPQADVPSGIPSALSGVTWSGNAFVAVSFTPFPQAAPIPGGGIITSPDGVHWTQRAAPDNASLRAVASGGGQLIAVGTGAPDVPPLAGALQGSVIRSTDDGETWSSSGVANPVGVAASGTAIAYGSNGWVYGGNRGSIYTSPDGLSPWTSQTLAGSRSYFAVAHDGTRYCAVGTNGAVASSGDGATWTEVGSVPDHQAYSVWTRLIHAAGLFVALGNSDAIMTSPDCQTWTLRNPAAGLAANAQVTSVMFGLAYGNGVFIASGEAYQYADGFNRSQTRLHVLTSPDAITWTAADPGILATEPLSGFDTHALAFGDGQFVMQSTDSFSPVFRLLTSPDGSTWTAQPASGFDPFEGFAHLIFAGGQFVGVGSRIWTSPDGLAWSLRQDYSSAFFNGVDHDNGLYVAVGNGGAIFTSPDLFPLTGVGHGPSHRFVAVGTSILAYADPFAPALSLGGVTVTEGDSGTTDAAFPVSLVNATGATVTVDYTTGGGSAGAGGDYVPTSGTLTFSGAVTSRTIHVPVIGDRIFEPDQTFLVSLSGATGATIAQGSGTGTIVNDDPLPALSVNDVTIPEGATGTRQVLFTVTLSNPTDQTVTVAFQTQDLSAVSPLDYLASSGTLTFLPGDLTRTLPVTVNGDLDAGATTTFAVDLSAATGAALARPQGIGTILDNGTAAARPDTTTWTTARSGIPGISGIAHGAGLYVAVGTAGEIWTSPDGVGWTQRANPDVTHRGLAAVTFGGGQFVAVGAGGVSGGGNAILTSPDGMDWTQRSNAAVPLSSLLGVGYGNGLYVAVGSGGARKIITSPDAITWSSAPNLANSLRAVTFGGGLFVAVGNNRTIVTSSNGATWTPQADVPPGIPSALAGVTWTGNRFVAVSFTLFPQSAPVPQGGIVTSTDGVHWTQAATPPENGSLRALASGGGQVVAVGSGAPGVPLLGGAAQGNVLRSTDDGQTWSSSAVANPLGVSPSGAAIAFGPAGFVYGGARGSIYTSPDGAAPWTSQTRPGSRAYLAVASDGARFCAVGPNGALASSSDGATWTEVTSVPDHQAYSAWTRLIHAAGLFVALGNSDAIMTSPDCQTWTLRNPPAGLAQNAQVSSIMFGLTYGNGLFVASGEAYQYADGFNRSQTRLHVLTSPDAITWTAADPGILAANPLSGFDTNSVAFGDGRFVLQATDSFAPAFLLLTSADGAAWTLQPAPTFDPFEGFSYLIFGGGQFVGVGSRIWTSPDGLAWTLRQDYSSAFFNGVDHDAGVWVAVGSGGAISVSTDGAVWTANTSPTAFTLSGISHSPSHRFVAVGGSILVYGDFQALLSVGDVSVPESAGTALFTVSLGSPAPQTVTVHYATANGTASAGASRDFLARSGNLTFAPGETQKTVAVPINDDAVDENDETFLLELSAASGAGLLDAQGVGTILDDDPRPDLSISNPSVVEGDTGTRALTFVVSLSAASGRPVTVSYQTNDGTAAQPADYTAKSGTLTFNPGVTTRNINVQVRGDTVDETPAEAFTVDLSAAVDATILDGQGTGTIEDDDLTASYPSLGVDDPVVGEAAGTATFTVSLSAPSAYVVKVRYATAPGTARAGASNDYLSRSGTLTFAPGTLALQVLVPVNDDTLDEDAESFVLDLSSPVKASIADAQGVATIVDDDAEPTLDVSDATLTEGDSGSQALTFTVTLSAASGKPVTVGFATAPAGLGPGFAAAPADYVAKAGTLSFAAGQTSKTFTVSVKGDTVVEGAEVFLVQLSGPTNAGLGDATGVGTILDND